MRIGIDGFNLAMPNGTGVATYGFSLAQTLMQMGHSVEGVFGLDVGQAPETRELMFYDAVGRERKLKRKDKWQHIHGRVFRPSGAVDLLDVPISDHVEKRAFADKLPDFSRLSSYPWLFEMAQARLQTRGTFTTVRVSNPPDVMHWTYPVPVRMHGCRNVYTIHDLVPLRLPYTTLDDKKLYYKTIEQCVETADQICTVSEASRDDILSRFDAARGKVTNTYQVSPIPEEVRQSTLAEDAAIVSRLFGLEEKKYFLFFGALDPKKNIDRILDAYQISGSALPLVVVLARDWGMHRGNSGVRDPFAGRDCSRIIRLTYLPRALLFRLVRAARAVALPSLFEGFGLPAFEAIQLGTPVIASNVSSLPEVVGNAGLLVDPYSVTEIAGAFSVLDSDAQVVARLQAHGTAQVEKFAPSAYRQKLADLYDRALA